LGFESRGSAEIVEMVAAEKSQMRSETVSTRRRCQTLPAARLGFAVSRRATSLVMAATATLAVALCTSPRRIAFATARTLPSRSLQLQDFQQANSEALVVGVHTPLRIAPLVQRHVDIGGRFGVLPEMPSPMIDTSEEKDPIWDRVIMAIQSADQKRGADISAFWTHQGNDVVIIITALSRPQLQAIANNIELNMRKKLRMKQEKTTRVHEYDIRNEAAAGWVCLIWQRMTVHIMTPVQRSYYDIEGVWRDENQDYEGIDIDAILKEDSFGNLKLKQDSGADDDEDEDYDDEDFDEDAPGIGGGTPGSAPAGFYEEDEEDPFWS